MTDLLITAGTLAGLLVGGLLVIGAIRIWSASGGVDGRSMIDRWDGLALVGLLVATAGAVLVNPWLVLVLYGMLAVIVGVWRGR